MAAELHIGAPVLTATARGQRLAVKTRRGCRSRTIWFRVPDGPISATVDPFLPIALIPAMRRGWRVTLQGPVSARLLQETAHIQDAMLQWNPRFRRVEFDGPQTPQPDPVRRNAAATFFSGGVDSFHTLRRHRDEITDLIFVHGFDVPLWKKRKRSRFAASIRAFAEEEGLRLIEVETNLRQFCEPHASWLHHAFGAALGAVALLLAPRFDRIYIPASVSADELVPMGSHPDLDPHWTNGQAEVVHDGIEATRFDKVRAIADWPPVHRHLRVCYLKTGPNLNCGRCRKCVWTMMMLEAVGALDRVQTFPNGLDLHRLQRFLPSHQRERQRFVKAIDMLEQANRNPEMQQVLRDMLAANPRSAHRDKITLLIDRASQHLAHLLPLGD